MDPQGQDMMAAFQQLFTPVVQFPRWFQPNKNIGAILVQSQEEEDELAARDWSPKPLPGSENPIAKIQTLEDVTDALTVLQNERDLFEQQKNTFLAQMDAKMAQMQALAGGAPSASSVLSPAPAPVSETASGADIPSASSVLSPAPAPVSETASGADIPGGLSDASDDVAEDPPAAAPVAAPKASKK